MVAGCTHFHFASATNVALVSIVVTGLAYPAVAEAGVDKLFHLGVDYLIRWDYIDTCGYRIRLEVS
jgi:hypothetical protein